MYFQTLGPNVYHIYTSKYLLYFFLMAPGLTGEVQFSFLTLETSVKKSASLKGPFGGFSSTFDLINFHLSHGWEMFKENSAGTPPPDDEMISLIASDPSCVCVVRLQATHGCWLVWSISLTLANWCDREPHDTDVTLVLGLFLVLCCKHI